MERFKIRHLQTPKFEAQANLEGRTHYADDGTLRFHYARVLKVAVTDNGLLLGLVESVALDMHNRTRGYRAVVFDLFGTVLTRSTLEDARKSKRAAEKDMWEALSSVDAKRHTLKAIKANVKRHREEMEAFARVIKYPLDGIRPVKA